MRDASLKVKKTVCRDEYKYVVGYAAPGNSTAPYYEHCLDFDQCNIMLRYSNLFRSTYVGRHFAGKIVEQRFSTFCDCALSIDVCNTARPLKRYFALVSLLASAVVSSRDEEDRNHWPPLDGEEDRNTETGGYPYLDEDERNHWLDGEEEERNKRKGLAL